MILYGPKTEKRLDLEQTGLVMNKPVQSTPKDIIYARLTKDDHLITVEQGTNDLVVKDPNNYDRTINSLKGLKEEPYSKLLVIV